MKTDKISCLEEACNYQFLIKLYRVNLLTSEALGFTILSPDYLNNCLYRELRVDLIIYGSVILGSLIKAARI